MIKKKSSKKRVPEKEAGNADIEKRKEGERKKVMEQLRALGYI